MTPQEYLEMLQKAYHFYPYLLQIRDLPQRIKQFDADPEFASAVKGLTERERFNVLSAWSSRKSDPDPSRGWVVRNHARLAPHWPHPIQEMFNSPDTLTIGELQTVDINGAAISVPGGGWVIALNSGVSTFLYAVARLIACCTNINIETKWGTTVSTRDCVISKADALQILRQRLSYYVEVGVPYGDDYPASEWQVRMASRTTTAAESFVFCHEVAHVVQHHHSGSRLTALTDGWLSVDEAAHSWYQEMEADRVGWELLLMSCQLPDDVGFAFAGASLFFQTVMMLDRLGVRPRGTTHPPAEERLDHIRQMARRYSQSSGIDWATIKQLEGAVSSRLQDLGDALVQSKPPLELSPYSQLVSECCVSSPPNYSRYEYEFLTWLSAGAPDKLCRAVAQVWIESEQYLRVIGVIRDSPTSPYEPTPLVDEIAQFHFRRLKLVLGTLRLYANSEIEHRISRYRLENIPGTERRTDDARQ
jgi:hypothetical protein